MRPRARTLPLLSLLFLPSCIPSTYVKLPAVRGRVLAADRTPVPHATLTVADAFNHSTVATFTTDADGRFSGPPTSHFFLSFPGMDFYLPPYTVSLTTGSHTTPAAFAPLGPEVHVFSFSASGTPSDLGDLTLVSATSPLLIPRRSPRTTKPAATAPAPPAAVATPQRARAASTPVAAGVPASAAVPAPAPARVAEPTKAPASRPIPPDPDPEFTAWLAKNGTDQLYPPGTPRTEILRRFPHPRLKGGTRVHDIYHRFPLGVGRPVGPGLPVDLRALAVLYDDFDVLRLIGSAQLVFVDRVLYDADGRVLGTERYRAH